MKVMQLLLIVGAAAGVYWLLTRNTSAAQASDDAPVLHVVEETLHAHAGEDNPIVHAFEAALEKA